jgi:cyanamide hydratase family protein with HD domain
MPFPKTFDAFVPSNVPDLFALAKINPAYISFDALSAIPLDDAHRAATKYTEKVLPKSAVDHSIRTYYFALAIMHNGFPSGTAGVPQITFEELQKRLYHAAVLHDLGWTAHPDTCTHPARTMSFELFGGIMAYEQLKYIDPALQADQVGDIVQSIMVHTTEYTAGQSSAVGALLVLGAMFDVLGYDGLGPGALDFLLHRKTVQEIEKVFPRGTFAADGAVFGNREFDQKPNCIMGHFRGGVGV